MKSKRIGGGVVAKIPPINIVLNIGGSKTISPKTKPPVKKKKKKDDDEKDKGILLKGLADIKASIERLPHTSHTGGG